MSVGRAEVGPGGARLRRALAVAVASLLLANAAVLVGRRVTALDNALGWVAGRPGALADWWSEGQATSSREASGAALPPAVPDASAVRALADELGRFVEATRGLRFKAPVSITVLEKTRFRERLLATKSPESRAAEAGRAKVVLQALGLVQPEIDLERLTREALTTVSVAFYDPAVGELVVEAARAITPFLRSRLVHELTYAVDDQHFGLLRPSLAEALDESAEAFGVLAEGSAGWVERRYLDSLTVGERRRAEAEGARREQSLPAELPRALLAGLRFPGHAGPVVVEALVASGGTARLDEAFHSPPISTEQLLHPDRLLAGALPLPLEEPQPDGEVVQRGVLGELGLTILLASVLEPATARIAADGWGADRYVAWSDGPRACIRATFLADSPTDHEELTRALADWVGRRPPGTLGRGESIVIRRCA